MLQVVSDQVRLLQKQKTRNALKNKCSSHSQNIINILLKYDQNSRKILPKFIFSQIEIFQPSLLQKFAH